MDSLRKIERNVLYALYELKKYEEKNMAQKKYYKNMSKGNMKRMKRPQRLLLI